MSQDAPSKTKEKKAQRDAERRRKGKKRKHDETVDVTDEARPQAELQKDFIPPESEDGTAEDAAPAVKAPKPKKRKRGHEDPAKEENGAAASPADGSAEGEPAKRKKRRKAKKELPEGANDADGQLEPEAGEKASKSRFILFIGNLPFNTTDASLQAYFKKLAPFTLRHRTDPKAKKSKGFAFLEFENYDRMETCLKRYHHSMFDPDEYRKEAGKFEVKSQAKGTKKGGRRINVELTAGGGGKGEARKEKIRGKNVHLEEERKRRLEQEAKENAANARKGASKQKAAQEDVPEVLVDDHTAGMHPSRLARMKV